MCKTPFKYLTFFCVLCLPLCLISRDAVAGKRTFAEVEALTLKYYNEGWWDSVIVVGKEALRDGIDYFYLRARMGGAYFEQGRYGQAVSQYRKAQEFNKSDPWVNQSLVVALERLGRREQAIASSRVLTASGKKTVGIENPVVQKLSFGGNMTWSNAAKQLPADALMGRDSICGYRDLYGDHYGGTVGITFGVSPHVFVDVGYSYMSFKKQQQYQYAWFVDSLVATIPETWGYYNVWAFPRHSATRSFDYTVNQQDFYIAPRLVTGNGWEVEPLFHLVYGKYHQTRMTYTREEVQNVWKHYYDPLQPDSTFTWYKDIYGFTQKDTSYTNYLVSMHVAKKWGLWGIGLQGSWSDFNGGTQGQMSLDLHYNPLGNQSVYGVTRGTGLFRKGDVPDWIVQQTVGVKLTKWLWLEATGIYGDYANGNRANGRWIYNLTDRIRYSASGTLVFTLLDQLTLTGTFVHEGKINSWYQVHLSNQAPPPDHVSTRIFDVDYHTNGVILGLQYQF